MNVREKALKILQEFRSQLDELDMSRQEYTKLQSYSRKVFKKMGELEAEPVETTGGECNGSCCGKHLCYKTCPCHQPKDAPKVPKKLIDDTTKPHNDSNYYVPLNTEAKKINEIIDYLEKYE